MRAQRNYVKTFIVCPQVSLRDVLFEYWPEASGKENASRRNNYIINGVNRRPIPGKWWKDMVAAAGPPPPGGHYNGPDAPLSPELAMLVRSDIQRKIEHKTRAQLLEELADKETLMKKLSDHLLFGGVVFKATVESIYKDVAPAVEWTNIRAVPVGYAGLEDYVEYAHTRFKVPKVEFHKLLCDTPYGQDSREEQREEREEQREERRHERNLEVADRSAPRSYTLFLGTNVSGEFAGRYLVEDGGQAPKKLQLMCDMADATLPLVQQGGPPVLTLDQSMVDRIKSQIEVLQTDQVQSTEFRARIGTALATSKEPERALVLRDDITLSDTDSDMLQRVRDLKSKKGQLETQAKQLEKNIAELQQGHDLRTVDMERLRKKKDDLDLQLAALKGEVEDKSSQVALLSRKNLAQSMTIRNVRDVVALRSAELGQVQRRFEETQDLAVQMQVERDHYSALHADVLARLAPIGHLPAAVNAGHVGDTHVVADALLQLDHRALPRAEMMSTQARNGDHFSGIYAPFDDGVRMTDRAGRRAVFLTEAVCKFTGAVVVNRMDLTTHFKAMMDVTKDLTVTSTNAAVVMQRIVRYVFHLPEGDNSYNRLTVAELYYMVLRVVNYLHDREIGMVTDAPVFLAGIAALPDFVNANLQQIHDRFTAGVLMYNAQRPSPRARYIRRPRLPRAVRVPAHVAGPATQVPNMPDVLHYHPTVHSHPAPDYSAAPPRVRRERELDEGELPPTTRLRIQSSA